MSCGADEMPGTRFVPTPTVGDITASTRRARVRVDKMTHELEFKADSRVCVILLCSLLILAETKLRQQSKIEKAIDNRSRV